MDVAVLTQGESARGRRLLTVNAGSTSIKLSVLNEDLSTELAENVPSSGGRDAALRTLIGRAGHLDAVVHRVVHGGPHHVTATRLDPQVIEELDGLRDLAPLHQPIALDAIRSVSEVLPDIPAYACFDTGYFHDLPAAASTYAVPADWITRYTVRRYGFQGLSHAYAARRAAEAAGTPPRRMVTCHLGGGASLAAIADGRPLDTTMGFTPLEGLVMGTRSGDVDPGLVLWMQTYGGLSAAEVSDALTLRSGLRGLCGSDDMREIARRAADGDEVAAAARAVYCHRLVKGIGAMAATLGGIDALIFTGGVGEGDAALRQTVCSGLGFLGITLDTVANGAASGDAVVSTAAATCRVFVVTAREDLEMARQLRTLLA